jgi:hypothetical protein
MAKKLALVNASLDAFGAPPLDKEKGSEFGWNDRTFLGWQDGKVFDYGDYEARDIEELLKKDYKARQIENVMVMPIASATWAITGVKGDTGEADWLNDYWSHDEFNGGCKTPLDQIIGFMTTAFSYRKAFFEKMWAVGTGDFDGKYVYDNIGFRPATTCRMMRDPRNGSFQGFQQEPYAIGPQITKGVYPILIPPKRAFVYLSGARRDPMNGSSDLEIPFWCYKTKQKLLFLWFQFLEGVSLPRTIVRTKDIDDANRIASQIAGLRSSGVLPIATPTGDVSVDTLDLSGKGAEQFTSAIAWLDQASVNSVLAGFLDLTGTASNGLRTGGGGSYALSKDASDFFLQSEEAKTREMEFATRRDLFAPLLRYNFGKKARIPTFKFEPLNDEDKDNSLTLLTTALASPANVAGIPADFVGMLAKQVGDYIGLDGDQLQTVFQKAAADATAAAAANGASPTGQAVAGVAGATDAASNVMSSVKAGKKPSPQNSDDNPFAMPD